MKPLRSLAVPLLIALAAVAANAETTPAPPDWQDGRGASVYMNSQQQLTQQSTPLQVSPSTTAANGGSRLTPSDSRYTPSVEPNEFSPPPSAVALPTRTEQAVKQVVHEEVASQPDLVDSRRLAPMSTKEDRTSLPGDGMTSNHHRLMDFGLPTRSIYTVVTALAIAVGSFLLFAWALRRGGKNSRLRQAIVPADAVSVLGRVVLTPRQFAELIRVGNKLVLVAMTPAGPSTITEVTDAAEVDRIVGACQQAGPLSNTKMFEQVFQQLSNEPTTNGFLGEETGPASMSLAASAYRSQRGPARV